MIHSKKAKPKAAILSFHGPEKMAFKSVASIALRNLLENQLVTL
jgi:hypothetical protein